MNPQSRMVIFAVTLLLGALSAQAAEKDRSDEPWIAVTSAKDQTFYIPKKDYDHFIGDSVLSGDAFVYYSPRLPSDADIAKAKKDYPKAWDAKVWPKWKLYKLPSKAEIERSEDAKKRYGWALAHISSPSEDKDPRLMRVLFYNLDDHKDGYLQRGQWVKRVADAKAKPTETPKPKPKPVDQPGGAQKPAGVDDDVWAMTAGAGAADRARYAQVLQKVKKKNSAEFKKIKEGGDAAAQKVVAAIGAVEKDLKAGKKPVTADSVYGELTSTAGGKKSRLQVALDDTAAAGGGLPEQKKPEDQKPGGKDDQATGAGGKEDESNPVNIINKKLLASPEQVGESIGERIADYIINGNEKGFVSADLRKKDDVMKRIKAQPNAWVREMVKQNKSVEVAQLYFVMGAGDQAPSWLADKKELSAALTDKKAQRTALFLEKMKVWAKTPADEKGIGQCAGADVVAWVHRFLGTKKDDAAYAQSAVAVADAILKNPQVSGELGEIARRIQERAEGVDVPGGTGSGTSPISGSAKDFDFASLYLRGGISEQFVYQSGDKVSRAVSIKIYTVKENGQLVNKIGVFDVTNPSDIYGQKFPISTANKESTFALDDRVAGKPKYTLKFEAKDNDTVITFGREGNPTQMETTLSKLYTQRAEQAVTEGNVAQVGGKSYYVLGQGGAKGSLLFFPPDLKDRIKSGGSLDPDLAAEVNQRTADGRNQNIPYKAGRDLGTVDGKPYHLEFNRDAGYWEVKDGAGDPDTPPKDPGTQTGTQTGTPTGTQPGAPTDATGIEDGLAKDGFKQNAAVRDGLRDDLKDKVRVWSWTKAESRPFATRHTWIFPAELFAPRNLPVPVPALDQGEAEAAQAADEVRGIVRFIATSRPSKTLYFDLDQPTVVEVKNNQPQNHPYKQAGYVNGGSFGVPDGALLKDAIERSKFPLGAKKIEDVLANFAAALKKREGNEAYTISGTAVSGALNVTFGANRLQGQIWPTLDQNFKTGGGHETNPGPGHAFDFSGLASDSGKPLFDTLDIPADSQTGNPAETVTKVAKADDDSAMLYANKEGTRWFFVYKFFVDDASKQVLRSGAGWVFAKGQKEKPAFPSVAVKVKGIKASAKPSNGEFRYAGDAAKGMWYAVKSKTINAQNATDLSSNCLGPVIFWGMDDAAALSACKKDSL